MSRSYEPNDNKRGFVSVIDEETKRKLWEEAEKATPEHVLETQLMDSRIPKDELAHYAKRQIEKLRAENERLRDALHIEFPGLVEVSKDAERYRWLRARINMDHMRDILLTTISGNVLDLRIDEAMKDG